MNYCKSTFALPLSFAVALVIGSAQSAWAETDIFASGAACDSYDQTAQSAYLLLSGPNQAVTAAQKNSSLPHLALSQAYALQLHRQAEVHFATAPQRSTLAEGSAAGIVEFTTAAAGLYRVNISDGSWLDLLDSDNQFVPAQAFHGRHQCMPLRKFVTYALEANSNYRIQFSGGTDVQLQLAVTRVGS